MESFSFKRNQDTIIIEEDGSVYKESVSTCMSGYEIYNTKHRKCLGNIGKEGFEDVKTSENPFRTLFQYDRNPSWVGDFKPGKVREPGGTLLFGEKDPRWNGY